MLKNKKMGPEPVRRAALYIRVSTEEQAKKGYSLPAQKEDLEDYAHRHGYAIVDYYIDEGKSARKKFTARREFMRMMEDVKANKIDVILFIKLDRWFRSVADYYKVQEVLDAHNVAWKTTQEHYDTETTNGRLYINIRLSVAQDESDRDSDRIKFVFASKVARGEVITGALPYGLMIQDKHVVPDPDKVEVVRALFRRFQETGSKGAALRYVAEEYGVKFWDLTVRKMLSNPLYKGQYRGYEDYCPAIISPEEFDQVQKLMQTRSVRTNHTHRIYLFSGLLICSECGKRMDGNYWSNEKYEYTRYRCRIAAIYHQCTHTKTIQEKAIESWLLQNVSKELDRCQKEWALRSAQRKKPRVDRAAILRKLDRLKDLYVEDLISMEQYKADYAKYTAKLAQEDESEDPEPDFSMLRTLLDTTLPNIYETLDRQKKQELWRSIIDHITIDGQNNLSLFFK